MYEVLILNDLHGREMARIPFHKPAIALSGRSIHWFDIRTRAPEQCITIAEGTERTRRLAVYINSTFSNGVDQALII